MQVCISSSFLFLHIDIYRDAIYNKTKKKANFFTLNYRKPIYNESKYKKGAITMKSTGIVRKVDELQSGYLESYNQEANGKLRKYYRITPNGKKYLEKMIEEWNAYANAVTSMIQYSV